ncbi:MAG: translocation/assembly module TamB domain-containing protein [Chitinophagales bacterium]
MKSILQKILRYTLYLILTFLVIFGILVLLLQQPSFQTWTTKKVTNYLSQKLDTRVEIGRVDIDFFKKIVLEDIYIEDLQKDTLLYAGKLKADIGMFSFFKQQLDITGINLENGRVNIKRTVSDSTYNFQFIIDAFTPQTPIDTTALPWHLQIDALQVAHTKVNVVDEIGGFELLSDIGDVELNINTINLNEQQVDLSWMDVSDAKIAYYLLPTYSDSLSQNIAGEPTSELSFRLPYTGWDIQIGELSMNNNRFIYQDKNVPIDSTASNSLEYTNFDLKDITGNFQDIEWTADKIAAELNNLTAREKQSDFYLKNLAANVLLDSTQVVLDNLLFETSKSNISTDIQLGFNSFDELMNFNENVEIEAKVKTSTLSMEDVVQLLPQITEVEGFNANNKETITFGGDFSGTVANIEAKNVSIKTANSTVLKGNGRITGLPDVYGARFNVQVQQLSSSYADLQKFLKGIPLPKGLKDLGRLSVSGNISGDAANFTAQKVKFTTNSKTAFSGNMHIEGLPDYDNMIFDIQADELTTSYEDIVALVEDKTLIPSVIGEWGVLDLSGHFAGNMDDFEGTEVRFYTEANSPVFEGKVGIQNIMDLENAYFDIEADKLQLTYSDINGLANGTLPPQMSNLGNISYNGSFEGGIYEFYLKGRLLTSIGNLQTDSYIKFNQDYSFANYRSQSSLEQFDIGKLIGNEQVGEVSLKGHIEGSGLTIESIIADIDVIVDAANYQGYTYQDVQMKGKLQELQFAGNLKSADPNARLTFDGILNFNKPNLAYQFETKIDTLNLKTLGLLSEDLRIHDLQIESDLKGPDLDHLEGDLLAHHIRLQSDTLFFELDSLNLKLRQYDNDKKRLTISSDVLVVDIDGNFNPTEVPAMMLRYINNHFDIKEFLDNTETVAATERPFTLSGIPTEEPIRPNYNFTIEMGNIVPLAKVFLPDLQQLDTLYLEGNFDDKDHFLHFDSYTPKLVYGNLILSNLELNTSGDEQEINLTLRMDEIRYGNSMQLPQSVLTASMFDDRLILGADIEGDKELAKLQFEGEILKLMPNRYQFSLMNDLQLNDKTWIIEPKNAVVFGPKFLNIRQFNLKTGEEELRVNSQDYEDGQAPIKIDFTKFALGEISNLLNAEKLQFGGAMNGQITLADPLQNLQFTSNLRIDDLMLNDLRLGNALMLVNQEDADKIAVNVNIAGGAMAGSILGDYRISSNAINLNINMQEWEMKLLDPFATTLIENSEGTFSGKLALTGKLDAPILTGRIKFNEANTVVVFSKTRYSLDNQEITFTNNSIELNNVIVKDELNQTAMVTGRIWHKNLDDLRLDLQLKTDNFHLLNTTIEDNDFYFGTIFMGANINVTGPVELIKIRGNASTKEGSTLYINQSSESIGGGEESFITFVDFSAIDSTKDTLNVVKVIRPEINTNVSGFDILVNLDARTNAEMQLIIDPLSDDRIICRGEGNLTVQMTPLGDFYLTGRYVIDQGSYTFTYEGIFQRNFSVRKGGYIDFVGDIFDARMHLSAVYKVKTGTYDLIANEINDPNSPEATAARRPTEVEVLMNLDGELLSPELTFDIQLPEIQGSLVNSAVLRKLQDIKDEEAELNKQVFGLLLFQNFILSQSNTNLGSTSENIALSSVSSLITSQLNNFAGKYVKGLEIGVSVDTYESGSGNVGKTTELELELRQRLFNDRLTIELGSNVDLSGEQNANVDGNTAFVGDFILTYKLTEDGRYLIRAFSKTDFDVFSGGNVFENGVGVSFRNSLKNKEKEIKKEDIEEEDRPQEGLPEKGLQQED